MKLEYDKEQLLSIMDNIVDKTLNMDLVWNWPCGVAYFGVARAWEVTGNQSYIDRLVTWVDEYMEIGIPALMVNSVAMGHVLITLYEATGDERYWELVMKKVDYLQKDALRFGERVFQHTVSDDDDFPEQAWADTLFMAAYFLLRIGIKLKKEVLIEDALNQYYWHTIYLQDKASGLWYHGYNNLNKDHMSGFHWGRANAWAAYTMSQVLRSLPEWYLYPKCMDIDCSLRDQLGALKNYQTENGLWRTLIDDAESYEEVSASCGIAAAMINNGNPMHGKYIQKSIKGILENVTDDGRVLNVSGGTAVMKDREGYQQVSKTWTQGWGQGLALAFLSDLLSIE